MQQERLDRLDQAIRQLGEQISALLEKPGTSIERIEYHFEQLKVDRLEGTLNIGITPETGGTIEDFAAGALTAQDLKVEKQQPAGSFTRIRERVLRFLTEDGIREIREREERFGKEVGEGFDQVMVEDLRKQVDDRIYEYLRRHSLSPQAEGEEGTEREIADKVIRDIRQALDNYFHNITKPKGEEP
jgi:spore germination protein PC